MTDPGLTEPGSAAGEGSRSVPVSVLAVTVVAAAVAAVPVSAVAVVAAVVALLAVVAAVVALLAAVAVALAAAGGAPAVAGLRPTSTPMEAAVRPVPVPLLQLAGSPKPPLRGATVPSAGRAPMAARFRFLRSSEPATQRDGSDVSVLIRMILNAAPNTDRKQGKLCSELNCLLSCMFRIIPCSE